MMDLRTHGILVIMLLIATIPVSCNVHGGSDKDLLLINEFEQNPPGNDNGAEWVELYNPTSSSIEVTGWTLHNLDGDTITLPQATIKGNQYYVHTFASQWLQNDQDRIVLKDNDGNEIDRTPTKKDASNDNSCWARYPDGEDTDFDSDWAMRTSTKGFSNGKPPANDLPVASFTIEPEDGTVNDTHTVDASDSYDPDGNILTYKWDWGDGKKTTGVTSSHKYESSGKYIIELTVIDDLDGVGTCKKAITVYPTEEENDDPFSDKALLFGGSLLIIGLVAILIYSAYYNLKERKEPTKMNMKKGGKLKKKRPKKKAGS